MTHTTTTRVAAADVMKDSMQGVFEDFQRLHNGVYCDKAFMQVPLAVQAWLWMWLLGRDACPPSLSRALASPRHRHSPALRRSPS